MGVIAEAEDAYRERRDLYWRMLSKAQATWPKSYGWYDVWSPDPNHHMLLCGRIQRGPRRYRPFDPAVYMTFVPNTDVLVHVMVAPQLVGDPQVITEVRRRIARDIEEHQRPQCDVPGCEDKARTVFHAAEAGRFAGAEREVGDPIHLCPQHAHDVYLAQGVWDRDQLPEWLRVDAPYLSELEILSRAMSSGLVRVKGQGQ